jgi:transposase
VTPPRRLARARAQRGAHVGPSPIDRARPGCKHHLICDAGGLPLAVSITGGNRNDVTQLLPLVDAIPPIRGRRGRPRRRPGQLLADRGYDYDIYRRQLRDRCITPKIARRGVAHGSGLGSAPPCWHASWSSPAKVFQLPGMSTRGGAGPPPAR